MTKKLKLLYVDDEIEILKTVHDSLEDSFEVIISTSPEDALQKLDLYGPDIILSDEKMPKMTGLIFLEKTISKRPKCLRLLTSAFAGEDGQSAIHNALRAHVIDDFIEKPFAMTNLVVRLEKAISDIGLRRDKEQIERSHLDLKTKHSILTDVHRNTVIDLDAKRKQVEQLKKQQQAEQLNKQQQTLKKKAA